MEREARAEIEVGTREKTEAVMLRKEGLSWSPHPSLQRSNREHHRMAQHSNATQAEKSSPESHQDYTERESERERKRACRESVQRDLYWD